MQENPFGSFWDELHKDADRRSRPVWITGKVYSLSPLVILAAGQQLSGTDLLVNTQLLGHFTTLNQSGISGSLSGSPEGMAVQGGSLQSTAALGGVLAQGDRVLLLPSTDGQQFAVVCKIS